MKTTFTFINFRKICMACSFALVIICMAVINQPLRAGNIISNSNDTLQMNTPIILTIQLTPYVYPNGYNISCFGLPDGSIDLTVSGGIPPYDYVYQWSNEATTEDISDLVAGYYTVEVWDEYGNHGSASITLTEPSREPIPEVNGVVSEYSNGYNVSCFQCYNGSIDLVITGGAGLFTYAWTDGPTSQDRYGLGGGTYSVTIRDASGCGDYEEVYRTFDLSEPTRDDWTMTGNYNSNPSTQFIGTKDNKDFVFRTNNTERLRILANGYVGIGTTNPTEKLTVAGNGKITGNFNVDGNIKIGNITATEKLAVAGSGKITDDFTVGKKAIIEGSLRIDSLAGVGFKTDSLSNKSYKLIIADELGNILPAPYMQPYPLMPDLCDYTNFPLTPWLTNGNSFEGYEPSVLGTCNKRAIQFITSGEYRMIIRETGKIGIGTLEPTQKLQVDGNIMIEGLNSTLLFGEDIPNLNAPNGQWGIEYEDAAQGLNFWKPSGSNGFGNYYLFLKDNGNVGIGTKDVPANYKLAVYGKIICEEVKVQLHGGPDWSDFVFDKNYKLMPLCDVEKYIINHKHLPDIPSADDVTKDGVSLGQTQALLLQKIEELTLYIIELNKEKNELKARIENIEHSK